MAIINYSDPSVLAASLAAISPVILGGITTWLKIFIEPQKEFRARITLKKKALLERVTMDHLSLMKHSFTTFVVDKETPLRGDGYEEPDLFGKYTSRVFKLVVTFHRLEVLKLVVNRAFWGLYIIIALGILFLGVNLIFEETRIFAFWYGIIAVVIEIALIGFVWAASQKLEHYEETA